MNSEFQAARRTGNLRRMGNLVTVLIRLTGVLLLSAAAVFAQVSGVATNKTTNKAQPGVKVTLKLMSEAGGSTVVQSTTTNAEGRFTFTGAPSGIYALESEFEGVKYTQIVPPMLPKDNIQVSVYDTTNAASALNIEQHIFFLEPGASQMMVSETYVLSNGTERTYRNPASGTIRFYLPPEAKDIVQTTITAPGQHPVPYTAERLRNSDLYRVDYPIPPGESRIDLNYIVPYEGGTGTFRTVNPYESVKTRLVLPPGVEAEGASLTPLGVEPRTKAQIFEAPGKEIEIRLSGTGMIADPNAGGESAEGDSPQVESSLPPIFANIKLITAAGGLALFFAFLLLYRRGSAATSVSGSRNEGGGAG
ncbi:MAG: hypothetical protein LC114_13005 [Bryobacterales bacterium]|nr:hypothetical protein [Bryobacterales bacterium]